MTIAEAFTRISRQPAEDAPVHEQVVWDIEAMKDALPEAYRRHMEQAARISLV